MQCSLSFSSISYGIDYKLLLFQVYIQLIALSFNGHAQNIRNKKILIRTYEESFDTEIMKKLRKFQSRAKTNFFIKISCTHSAQSDNTVY